MKLRHLAQRGCNLRLAARGGNLQRFGSHDALRNRVVDQRAQRVATDDAQHLGHIGRVGADVSIGKGVRSLRSGHDGTSSVPRCPSA
jgi:hypothetical protein